MPSGERDPEDQLTADARGGQLFEPAGDSSGIVKALGAALEASLSDVEVALVARGPGAEELVLETEGIESTRIPVTIVIPGIDV